jgi:hypothetical protein
MGVGIYNLMCTTTNVQSAVFLWENEYRIATAYLAMKALHL